VYSASAVESATVCFFELQETAPPAIVRCVGGRVAVTKGIEVGVQDIVVSEIFHLILKKKGNPIVGLIF